MMKNRRINRWRSNFFYSGRTKLQVHSFLDLGCKRSERLSRQKKILYLVQFCLLLSTCLLHIFWDDKRRDLEYDLFKKLATIEVLKPIVFRIKACSSHRYGPIFRNRFFSLVIELNIILERTWPKLKLFVINEICINFCLQVL